MIAFFFFFIPSFFKRCTLCEGYEKRTTSVEFKNSKKNGGKLLVINGIRFFRNRQRNGKQYWKCSYYYKEKCPTIAILNEDTQDIKMIHEHSHSINAHWRNWSSFSKCGFRLKKIDWHPDFPLTFKHTLATP